MYFCFYRMICHRFRYEAIKCRIGYNQGVDKWKCYRMMGLRASVHNITWIKNYNSPMVYIVSSIVCIWDSLHLNCIKRLSNIHIYVYIYFPLIISSKILDTCTLDVFFLFCPAIRSTYSSLYKVTHQINLVNLPSNSKKMDVILLSSRSSKLSV